MWRVAGPDLPASDRGPAVTVQSVASATYDSGLALAQAFGATVLEPSWWPADTEEISYSLNGAPGHMHYSIGSTRADGVPISSSVIYKSSFTTSSWRSN
jgi:hypothetical protein